MKLDVGSGRRPTGDINVDLNARNRPTVAADVRNLPFRDGIFDHVYASHIIEHMYEWDLKVFLREIRRVLTDDGLFEVITPNMCSFLHILHLVHQEPCMVGYVHGYDGNFEATKYLEHHTTFTPRTLMAVLEAERFFAYEHMASGDDQGWKYIEISRPLVRKYPLWSREIHYLCRKSGRQLVVPNEYVAALKSLAEVIG